MAREKRSAPRFRKRLLVRYGETDLERSGFTADASTSGLFIVSSTLPALDTRLHVQLFLGEGDFLYFEGRVARHRLVPVELRTIEKAGFGLKLLSPAELLAERIGKRAAAAPDAVPRFEVGIDTAAALRDLWERELRHGHAFVTSDRTLARDEVAEIELRLRFAPGAPSLRFSARVLQVLEIPGAAGGIGFEFLDRQAVADRLEPLLAG